MQYHLGKMQQAEELAVRTEPSAPATSGIPWHIRACVIALTCSGVGSVWDISWHSRIGRDTFWTAPHILIYLSGVIAGLSCGYVILSGTFGRDRSARASAATLWGFRGPLGAFLCAWGSFAMIASAPFDNWWHSAYGLDVKVLSPPHVVLMLGMIAIRFGTMILIMSCLNRAQGRSKTILDWLLFYLFMSLMSISLGAFQEHTVRTNMHSAAFYLLVSIVVPLWLGAVSHASGSRWACTGVGVIYTAEYLAFVWILPRFAAEPKLGPVYQTVTQFVPPAFPLLLIVPAIALDLARRRFANWPEWRQAAASGIIFLAAFLAVQWPFAAFLQSPAARNWFFGTKYIPYFVPLTTDYARYVFTPLESGPQQFSIRMGLALAAAVTMSRLGLTWGEGLRKLRR